MTKSHSLIIGVSIVLGCLIMNLQSSTPVAGQSPQLPQGQYQIMAAQLGPGDVQVFVLDTKTGQTWTRHNANSNQGDWKSLGSPVK